MDVHSLTRRELQALCKKNKIPANMTNVAMADALSTLENVEGLDEIMNQSPGKTISESPSVPRTATRTATRKKPIQTDIESAQPTTRTRRVTRKIADNDLDQENKNVNMPQTPAVQTGRRRAPVVSATKQMENQEEMKMTDLSGTPALNTGRRKTQAASARTKAAEASAQRVHSTRQSVRLLEKNMASLSLKKEGKTEPFKMGALDESEDKNKDESAESSEDNTISEVSSVVNASASLENEEKLTDDNKGKDINVEAQNSDNLDDISLLNAKDAHDEEMDIPSAENCEKLNGVESGLAEAPVADNPTENEKASAEVVEPKESPIKKVYEDETGLVDVPVIELQLQNDDVPAEAMKQETPLANSVKEDVLLGESGLVDLPVTEIPFDTVDASFEATKQEDVLLANACIINDEKETNANDSELILDEKEACHQDLKCEHKNVSIGMMPAEELQEAVVSDKEESGKKAQSDEEESGKKAQSDEEESGKKAQSDEKEQADEDKKIRHQDIKCELKNTILSEEPEEAVVVSAEEHADNKDSEVLPEEKMICHQELKSETSAIVPNEVPDTVVTTPAKQISAYHCSLVCTTDSIGTQFPRPNKSTPGKFSSQKQATTDQKNKLTIFATDDKENIDESGMKVEPSVKKDKFKNIKNNTVDENSPLDEKSLRKLTKMLRDKLAITNKNKMNNDEQNVGKTRLALQTIQDNVIVSGGELEKEN